MDGSLTFRCDVGSDGQNIGPGRTLFEITQQKQGVRSTGFKIDEQFVADVALVRLSGLDVIQGQMRCL